MYVWHWLCLWCNKHGIAVDLGNSDVKHLGSATRGCIGSCWGKPEGRRPLGRPRLRWVDNIRMDLQEVGCGYMDWIGLAQDGDGRRTFVSTVMNIRVP